ncbi:MAG TPA: hypothetical protein VIC71_02185 [Gammaproteobacteria bacterium]|jgi:hypothetical protein
MRIRFALLLVSVATAANAQAQDDWRVILNGRAIHLNAAREWNEHNWGLGVEREFDTDERWVKVALANGFKDSLGNPSYMAGGGIKHRFRLPSISDTFYVDVGAIAFLMAREDVDHGRPFPGVLPALTVGTRNLALNVTYMSASSLESVSHMPLKDRTMTGVLFLQLKLNPRLLAPR